MNVVGAEKDEKYIIFWLVEIRGTYEVRIVGRRRVKKESHYWETQVHLKQID